MRIKTTDMNRETIKERNNGEWIQLFIVNPFLQKQEK